jgi:ribosomal protein S1
LEPGFPSPFAGLLPSAFLPELPGGVALGLIPIIEFKDDTRAMSTEEYPEVDAQVEVVVIALQDRDHQVKLSCKPSRLLAQ